MTLFMFSLAGIPGTAGFMGKFLVFSAAVDAGQVPLAILGVLMSVVSVYYYLRVPVLMYMREPGDEAPRAGLGSGEIAVLAVCAVGVLYLGIFPNGCAADLRRRARARLGARLGRRAARGRARRGALGKSRRTPHGRCAVHPQALRRYPEMVTKGDVDGIVALYADDATIEDPIGSPLHRGIDAIRKFYQAAAGTVTMKRVGPVHVAGREAATPLQRAARAPKAARSRRSTSSA